MDKPPISMGETRHSLNPHRTGAAAAGGASQGPGAMESGPVYLVASPAIRFFSFLTHWILGRTGSLKARTFFLVWVFCKPRSF